MEIIYPTDFSLTQLNDTYFWRYIELHKLFDLLLNKQIFFSRLDSFEDGLEGLTEYGLHLKLFTHNDPYTYENINPTFDKETKDRIIEQDRYDRKKYEEQITTSQQTQFASCWFHGNRESIAMWKLYSQKDGVALKFNARELTDTILAGAKSYTNTDFHHLTFGPVVYKNIWPFDSEETFENRFNAMKKDKSYIHENEFRFIAVIPVDKKGVYKKLTLPIGELSTYDLQIITNPFMEEWKVENLMEILKPYNVDTKVIKSQIEIRMQKNTL
jgi:hypothetical protein